MIMAVILNRSRREGRSADVLMSVLVLDSLESVTSFLSQLSVLCAHRVLNEEEVELRRKGDGKPEDSKEACQDWTEKNHLTYRCRREVSEGQAFAAARPAGSIRATVVTWSIEACLRRRWCGVV